jgi:hypothetical protein
MNDEFYKLARPLMRGVRVDIRSGVVSDNVKNRMVRDILGGMPQFTGEVVVGNPVEPDCHEMTEDFLNDSKLLLPFVFWVYDMKTVTAYPLRERLKITEPMITACHPCIQFVDHELLINKKELDSYAKKVVTENYFPGIVLREPFGTFGTRDEEIGAEGLGLALQ